MDSKTALDISGETSGESVVVFIVKTLESPESCHCSLRWNRIAGAEGCGLEAMVLSRIRDLPLKYALHLPTVPLWFVQGTSEPFNG
jgi:hypothetical protein